jgi:cation diffusion facilitator CzcD-associated flavoprotein CzcO
MGATKTVVIVGGGFSGATFGLKLHRQCPDWRIIIAEPKKTLGRGVAYGACGPDLELTRFSGHPTVRFGGVQDGKQDDNPVHAGV